MKLSRYLQWAHALFDTAVAQCRIAKEQCLLSVWRSMKAFWSIDKADTVDRKTWFVRMRACSRCPVYDHRLKRCHNRFQLHMENGVERPFGCGCYMPIKASLKGAECWLSRYGRDQWLP